MIYEYGLEPQLVATWRTQPEFRYFAAAFGLGRPRLVAEYPSKGNWRRQVLRAAAGASDMELQRLTGLLTGLTERMVARGGWTYDGVKPWLENAEVEHLRQPFR